MHKMLFAPCFRIIVIFIIIVSRTKMIIHQQPRNNIAIFTLKQWMFLLLLLPLFLLLFFSDKYIARTLLMRRNNRHQIEGNLDILCVTLQQQQFTQVRCQWQFTHECACPQQRATPINRIQQIQRMQCIEQRCLVWRIQILESQHIANATHFETENGGTQIDAQYLGHRLRAKLAEFSHRIQSIANAIRGTTRSTLSLQRRTLTDVGNDEFIDACLCIVQLMLDQAGVHHKSNAIHSQRCLRHIRRKYNLSTIGWRTRKYALLRFVRKSTVCRQNDTVGDALVVKHKCVHALRQPLTGAFNLLLSGEETEDIAWHCVAHMNLRNGVNAGRHIICLRRRTMQCLHREASTTNVISGYAQRIMCTRTEKCDKLIHIECRRCNEQFEGQWLLLLLLLLR
mmetsp:Transcript_20922/g.33514  ORF Transcript_20922/g.33514 Transcript_20922/m.33514 type:complete len:396 (-) Transcript_20922:523-1710(-)